MVKNLMAALLNKEYIMKKSIFAVVVFVFSLFVSNAFATQEPGIRDFSYKGTSFNSTVITLQENGFRCDSKDCFKGEEGFEYDPGLFFSTVTIRNAVTVEFHENNVRKIVVEQAYPASGENCMSIMKDIKVRFDKKYGSDLKFPIIRTKMSESTDYDNLSGKVTLNNDVLASYFNCVFGEDHVTNNKVVYLKASFVYDNLAARLLIDGI